VLTKVERKERERVVVAKKSKPFVTREELKASKSKSIVINLKKGYFNKGEG